LVAVAESKAKKTLFSVSERVEFVSLALRNFENVSVKPFDNSLVEFAKSEDITVNIRGLRDSKDFEYEREMNYANRSIYREFNTVYVNASLEHSFVSSSIVRAFIEFGNDISHLVPEEVVERICKR
jgi:pantetheine-phosphate adenylyltransferase